MFLFHQNIKCLDFPGNRIRENGTFQTPDWDQYFRNNNNTENLKKYYCNGGFSNIKKEIFYSGGEERVP